jgi:hypothetical protein
MGEIRNEYRMLVRSHRCKGGRELTISMELSTTRQNPSCLDTP